MKQSTSRKESNMSLLEELEALANRVDVLAQSLCLSVGVESDRHEATEIAKAIRAFIASSREEEKPRYRCEGCGEWLDEKDVEGIGTAIVYHVRAVPDKNGDPEPEQCGPVSIPSASAGTEGPGLCEAIERFRRERGVHKGPHYLATAENPDGTIRTCAQCWEAYSKAEDDLDTAIAEGGKR